MNKRKIYNIVLEHFDRLSQNYDIKSPKRENYNSRINSIIVDYLSTLKHSVILDVGCGTGSRAKKILESVRDYEYWGCDISGSMIAKAKEQGIENATTANILNLPYNEEQFDVVLCLFNVLGYLSDKKDLNRAFNEIARVVKTGGVVFIDVMNKRHQGEGLEYYNSFYGRLKILLKSWIIFKKSFGQLFEIDNAGEKLLGYVRGFGTKDIMHAIQGTRLEIQCIRIIGYDSGNIYTDIHKGQLFFELIKK